MAVSDEDITMVVIWPSFREIIGPWVWANVVRVWWGLWPSWRRFPIMGRPRGPGGSGSLSFERRRK